MTPVTTDAAIVKAKTRQSTVTAAPPVPIRGIAVVVSPSRNGLLPGYISNSILTPIVPTTSPSAPLMNDRTTLSVSNWRRMRRRPAPSAVLNRHLACSEIGADEQQIRDVDAGDE